MVGVFQIVYDIDFRGTYGYSGMIIRHRKSSSYDLVGQLTHSNTVHHILLWCISVDSCEHHLTLFVNKHMKSVFTVCSLMDFGYCFVFCFVLFLGFFGFFFFFFFPFFFFV